MIWQSLVRHSILALLCLAFATLAHAAGAFPDLTWSPLPLTIPTDPDARYIDFDKGNDSNPGTRASPWKHHPWDPEAAGKARWDSDTATFYFKKGVTYRGRLVAKRSGTEARPIVLGVASDWGTGTARISGAQAIESGWRLCRPEDGEGLPRASLGKAWCLDTTLVTPQALWAISGDTLLKLVPARQPNWSSNNADDPRAGWAVLADTRMRIRITTSSTEGFMTGDRIEVVGQTTACDCVVRDIGFDYLDIETAEQRIKGLQADAIISNGRSSTTVKKFWGTHEILRQLTDPGLRHVGPHDGAVIWVEESYMPKPFAGIVTASSGDHIESNLHLPPSEGPEPFNRYFLEGLLNYLDAPGEFAVRTLDRKSVRLFVRLPKDADPNQWCIEIPQKNVLVDISSRQHIRIAGLEFVFARQVPVGTDEAQFATLNAAAIEIRGSSVGIRIDHNRMLHLPAGVVASPAKTRDAQKLDRLSIEDNDFEDIEGSAIALSSGWNDPGLQKTGSRLIHVSVLRNRITNNGYRTLAHWSVGAHGHAIEVTGGELVEVAWNHVRRTWGSGISVLMGSDYSRGNVERPLIRGLVHHNKVVDSVLGLQDYGGIASWLGGPLYMYDNISGNAVGYRYDRQHRPLDEIPLRTNSFAMAYYFDGQYKGYAFNNIGWGKNNDIHSSIYNSVGFKEAMGFMNAVFNNTFYRVAAGLHKDMPQHNRSYYLGNVFADIGHKYIQHEVKKDVIDYETLTYGHNVYNGPVEAFGQLGAGRRNVFPTLAAWKDNLRQHGAIMSSDSDVIVTDNPLPSAMNLDFRPAPGSAVIDRGVRFFVPWGLARVVAEWHFYASESRPQRVVDESINMNSEWIQRSMFAQIPRRDLDCPGISAGDYISGTLEDWTHGALKLDGQSRYCHVSHATSLAPYEWQSGYGKGRISALQRETLDIGGGNLTIEVVIRPLATGRDAGLLGKIADNGYSVHVTPDGRLRVTLDYGKDSCKRLSNSALTDGAWHHVLIEIDRRQPDGITIYVDGRLDNGVWQGHMSNAVLRNEADFTIGRVGTDYYAGAVDFVRVAKSTLRESETDIRELYQWEFDGPALRDFSGEKYSGATRDAGAVEASVP